jgi:hypothetical protein
MRPLTWALKEVDLVGLHRQSGIHQPYHHVWNRSETERLQIKKNGRKMPPTLANGALCTMVNLTLGEHVYQVFINVQRIKTAFSCIHRISFIIIDTPNN